MQAEARCSEERAVQIQRTVYWECMGELPPIALSLPMLFFSSPLLLSLTCSPFVVVASVGLDGVEEALEGGSGGAAKGSRDAG